MGMYTEFIFGCELSKNTPKECIDALDYSINGETKKPKYKNPKGWEESRYNDYYIERTTPIEDIEAFCDKYELHRLFHSCSAYFGAANPISKFYWDPVSDAYHISTRADLKNGGCIEDFITYIKPYVTQGSGFDHHIFAYVQYEQDEFPTIYGIDGTYHVLDPAIKKEFESRHNKWFDRLSDLYQKLAPEYCVTEAEKVKHGHSSDYGASYDDAFEWMTEYIIEKYQKQPVTKITVAETGIILERAVSKIFDKYYYSENNDANRFTKKELDHLKEIKLEFVNLLTQRYKSESNVGSGKNTKN